MPSAQRVELQMGDTEYGDVGLLKLVAANTKPATKLYTRREEETACLAVSQYGLLLWCKVKAAERPTVTDRVRRR